MHQDVNKYRRGFAARANEWVSAQEQEAREEWNPNTPPVLTNKGTLQTTGGGLPQFRASSGTSGGTVLLTVDPDTGTITLAGPVTANITLDVGTINNTVIAGQGTITGTVTNNGLIQNGNYNSGTFNTGVLGTPNISGGTHNNAFFGTLQTAGGTIGTPIITGTPTFATQAGSNSLAANGNFAMQFFSGSPVIAFRYGGTTFKFVTTGTI